MITSIFGEFKWRIMKNVGSFCSVKKKTDAKRGGVKDKGKT